MHFDVEHSFLLQVKGAKHVSVASFDDDPVARHRELDRYIDGEECDFEAMQAAPMSVIGPGVGVYLPSYVPHWVETEAGVSISFSIPFFTSYTERAEGVSRINRRLRQLHSRRGPLGASESVDKTKAGGRSVQGSSCRRRATSCRRNARLAARRRRAAGAGRGGSRRGTRTVNRTCTCGCRRSPASSRARSGRPAIPGSLGDSTSTRFRTTASP